MARFDLRRRKHADPRKTRWFLSRMTGCPLGMWKTNAFDAAIRVHDQYLIHAFVFRFVVVPRSVATDLRRCGFGLGVCRESPRSVRCGGTPRSAIDTHRFRSCVHVRAPAAVEN